MTASAGDELSRLLDALREEAGVSGAEIARRCGWSEAKVSRFLHGKIIPKPDQVRGMLDAMTTATYRVDDERRRRAIELSELHPSGHATRQHILRGGSLVAQRRYAEIESASSHVQTLTRGIVPGLLQSAGYAAKVFATEPGLDENAIRVRVEHRLERRSVMLAAGAERRYTQVITEGALRWNAGLSVMIEQCELLAEIARTAPPHVKIGLIPWWQVVDAFPMVEINLYDERAVIINTGDGVTHITSPNSVQVYAVEFRHLCSLAIWGPDAATEFDRIADDYRKL